MKKFLFAVLLAGTSAIACAQQPAQRQADPKAPKVEEPKTSMTHSSCKNAHRCPHAQRTCQQQQVATQAQADSARVNTQSTNQQSNAVGKPRKPRKSSK